jgi:hypothetical protein
MGCMDAGVFGYFGSYLVYCLFLFFAGFLPVIFVFFGVTD